VCKDDVMISVLQNSKIYLGNLRWLTTASQPFIYGFIAIRGFMTAAYDYIRGRALGRTDTASALGRCRSLPTPEVRYSKVRKNRQTEIHT